MAEHIGTKIKRLRGWMPQAELARKIGVGRAAVWSWEQGNSRPSTDVLPRLAQALGVTIDALFASDEQPTSATQEAAS